MPTDENYDRATFLIGELNGDKTINEWIVVLVKAVAFLLNRYRLGD